MRCRADFSGIGAVLATVISGRSFACGYVASFQYHQASVLVYSSRSMNLQKNRERLVLILIGLLPLHAFLVTVSTKMIAGPGQAPLPVLALWKEFLLVMILLLALLEIIRNSEFGIRNLNKLSLDIVDGFIVALIILSFIVSIPNSAFRIPNFLFGFKYDFLPLVAFLILRRVPWSPRFISTGGVVLLGGGVIVALYGLAAMVLPADASPSSALSPVRPHRQ